MRRRKSLFTLLVVVTSLALVASACGRSNKKSSSPSNSSGTTTGGNKTPSAGPGFDGTTITLGVVSPLSGAAAIIGKPLTAGNQMFWNYYNAEKGGIAGKYKVKLEIEDSAYDPPTAIQKYSKLKDGVVLFNQFLGTPVVKAALPQIKADGLVASPATLDADWVHEPNLIPIDAPYQTQFINAADYYLNSMGGKGKTICFMGSDDPYGDAGLAGLKFAAQKLNFSIAVEARFKATDTQFTAQLTQLKNGKCDAVFLTALPTVSRPAVEAGQQLGFTPQWFGQSPTWISLWATSVAMQQHFILVSEGPDWGDTSVLGMKEMLDHLNKYDPTQKPDIYYAFGYTESWSVAQILEQAVKDGDLSRQGIQKAMENVGKITFDNLVGDYTYGKAADRKPPTDSSFFKVDPTGPGGLKSIKTDYSSDAAKAYKY